MVICIRRSNHELSRNGNPFDYNTNGEGEPKPGPAEVRPGVTDTAGDARHMVRGRPYSATDTLIPSNDIRVT